MVQAYQPSHIWASVSPAVEGGGRVEGHWTSLWLTRLRVRGSMSGAGVPRRDQEKLVRHGSEEA